MDPRSLTGEYLTDGFRLFMVCHHGKREVCLEDAYTGEMLVMNLTAFVGMKLRVVEREKVAA